MRPFRSSLALLPFLNSRGFAGPLLGALGGGLGVGFAAWISLWLASALHVSAWLVAPLGASAVLVFTAPASPFARPHAVIAGNTISALVGIAVTCLVHSPVPAICLAVGLAIAVMSLLRCLHPPGGGTALLCVLLHVTDPVFAIFPTLVNSALLVVFALAYNNLPGRGGYPVAAKPTGDVPATE